MRDWWLDAIAGSNWDVVLDIRGNHILGGWVFIQASKYGIPYLCNAALSPYQGVFYCYPEDLSRKNRISFENQVLSNLYSLLPKTPYIHQTLYPGNNNLLQLIWAGFSVQFRYTYMLNDLSNTDRLWNQIHPRARRTIQKFEDKDDIHITESDNPKTVYDLHSKSMANQEKRTQLSFDSFRRLDQALNQRNCRKIYVGKNKNGRDLGAIYVVWSENRAYYLLGGVDRAEIQSNMNVFLLWHAIRDLSSRVLSFDFEGSMLPGVERIFRYFGAEQIVYPEIKKYKFPLNLIKIWK